MGSTINYKWFWFSYIQLSSKDLKVPVPFLCISCKELKKTLLLEFQGLGIFFSPFISFSFWVQATWNCFKSLVFGWVEWHSHQKCFFMTVFWALAYFTLRALCLVLLGWHSVLTRPQSWVIFNKGHLAFVCFISKYPQIWLEYQKCVLVLVCLLSA